MASRLSLPGLSDNLEKQETEYIDVNSPFHWQIKLTLIF
jgi:hypothetical protein